MQLERTALYYWGVAQRKPSMLAKRGAVDMKCWRSHARVEQRVPLFPSACWESLSSARGARRGTACSFCLSAVLHVGRASGSQYTFWRVHVKMQIPQQPTRSSQERILASSRLLLQHEMWTTDFSNLSYIFSYYCKFYGYGGCVNSPFPVPQWLKCLEKYELKNWLGWDRMDKKRNERGTHWELNEKE